MDTGQLVDDMNKIYSLIYGEKWNSTAPDQKFLTRALPHTNYRHIVRYMVQRERGATYKAVAEAEGLLFEVDPPNHATIINSIKVSKDQLYNNAAYKNWFKRIGFFYDLRNDGDQFLQKLNECMEIPGFAMAITIASIVKMNLVHEDLVQVLLNEYRELDENFVMTLLQTKTASAAAQAD